MLEIVFTYLLRGTLSLAPFSHASKLLYFRVYCLSMCLLKDLFYWIAYIFLTYA